MVAAIKKRTAFVRLIACLVALSSRSRDDSSGAKAEPYPSRMEASCAPVERCRRLITMLNREGLLKKDASTQTE